MNLFFLNVGRRCELVEAFSRALCRVSPGVIWGSDPNPLAPGLAVVDRIAELPSRFDNQEFPEALGAFLMRERIDLLIPTIDPDLVRLHRWREQLQRTSAHTRILLSPSLVVQTARDKRKSRDAFAALGVAVPTALDPRSPNLQFPVFIKPAAGSGSVGARRIDDRAALEQALVDTEDPMVEALVGGDETTVDVLLDFEGRALKAVPRRRLQTRGGEVSRGVLEVDPTL